MDLLLGEMDGSGNVLRSYTWGSLGLVDDHAGTGTRVYLFDAVGNTRAVVSGSGQALGWAAYTAWGSAYTSTLPGDVHLTWNGRSGAYADPETALYVLGQRYYSPSLGRFLTRDPLGVAGGTNPYAYCGGDPLNFHDPLGLWDQSDIEDVPDGPMRINSSRVGTKAGQDMDALAGQMKRGLGWTLAGAAFDLIGGGIGLLGEEAVAVGGAVEADAARLMEGPGFGKNVVKSNRYPAVIGRRPDVEPFHGDPEYNTLNLRAGWTPQVQEDWMTQAYYSGQDIILQTPVDEFKLGQGKWTLHELYVLHTMPDGGIPLDDIIEEVEQRSGYSLGDISYEQF